MRRLIQKKSSKEIFLYHGTSSLFLENIFKDGLLPEGFTKNKMFDYDNYKRNGEPSHVECVYLTDNLDVGKKFASNACEKKGGFPIVIKVKVNKDALIWDEYALFRNFGDFDFGEKNYEKIKWKRKPKSKLWEQSLQINNQCAHYGKIGLSKITGFLFDEKWINLNEFKKIIDIYKNIQFHNQEINHNKLEKTKDFIVQVDERLKATITIVDRNVYIYNLKLNGTFTKDEEKGICVKIFEFIRSQIEEFGMRIIYSSDFNKKIKMNPKKSVFSYLFGFFDLMNDEDILSDISEKLNQITINNEIFEKIINGNANNNEFQFVYEYSIDFVGDLIVFCKEKLKYSNEKIINVLNKIKQKYKHSYEQLEAEIEYISFDLKNK